MLMRHKFNWVLALLFIAFLPSCTDKNTPEQPEEPDGEGRDRDERERADREVEPEAIGRLLAVAAVQQLQRDPERAPDRRDQKQDEKQRHRDDLDRLRGDSDAVGSGIHLFSFRVVWLEDGG